MPVSEKQRNTLNLREFVVVVVVVVFKILKICIFEILTSGFENGL